MESNPSLMTRKGSSTRVDKAHQHSSAPIPKAKSPSRRQLALLAGVAESQTPNLTVGDQLDRQANELAERLQSRQRELDCRESTFMAQVARLENELRSARLLNQELREQLEAREGAIQLRERELDRQAADLLHAESTCLAEANEQSASASQMNEDAKLTIAEWQRRIAELDRGERLLKSQLADTAFKQKALDKQRKALLEESKQRDDRIKRERNDERGRFEKQLAQLQQRQEEVERRAVSVQQLHQDTCHTYRETIELRIATEQVWAQLANDVSTAELTRRLAGWRKKLMDQFALANASLEKQQADNVALLEELRRQAESLRQMRDELREWMSRRQQELVEESEKLLARERELDREQAHVRHLEHQWTEQKANYEQEIRRLRRMAS